MATLGPFSEPVPDRELASVAKVAPSVEIRDIRLVGLSAQLKGKCPPSGSEIVLMTEHNVTYDFLSDTSLAVQVLFTLKANGPGQDGPEFFNLSASHQLTYTGDKLQHISADKITAFASINAVHNAWPYLRELIQSITGRMKLPPLTLPLLKVRRAKNRAARPRRKGQSPESRQPS